MAENQNNSTLNVLLINIGKSLLQYVGESWPWTDESAHAEQTAITAMVARQKRHVARLADLLSQRNWNLDFGTYPTEYTDLHFVALDFLLPQIITNEEGLIGDIEQTLKTCEDDSAVVKFLEEILADQREIVKQLQELLRSHTRAA